MAVMSYWGAEREGTIQLYSQALNDEPDLDGASVTARNQLSTGDIRATHGKLQKLQRNTGAMQMSWLIWLNWNKEGENPLQRERLMRSVESRQGDLKYCISCNQRPLIRSLLRFFIFII